MNSNPNPIDVHVGNRIRLRRKVLGVSQEQLAEALGLSFQQLQKYEKATNRISASKLLEVARRLDAGIAYFFDGLAGADGPGSEASDGDLLEVRVAMPEVLLVARLPVAQRRALGGLITSMAET